MTDSTPDNQPEMLPALAELSNKIIKAMAATTVTMQHLNGIRPQIQAAYSALMDEPHNLTKKEARDAIKSHFNYLVRELKET